MKSFEKYIRRLAMNGDTPREVLIKRSRQSINERFQTSASYHRVLVNDEEVDAIIHRTTKYDEKIIYFHYDYPIVIGSIVEYLDDKYLILEKDKDTIHSFAKMARCNGTFQVQTDSGERELVGHDSRGRPIYNNTKEYRDEPCIYRDRYYSANENAQLPLPEGKLDIVLKYQKADNIEINKEFMYQDKLYKISDVSYVDVSDGHGVMTIHAERREDKNE